MTAKVWLSAAAVSALTAVAAGAFGAHGLKARLSPELLAIFETAARYHMYHALGLAVVATLGLIRPDVSVSGPAASLLVGTVIFSGSLYALALSGQTWLGAITPIGGLAFMIGWGWLAWTALRL